MSKFTKTLRDNVVAELTRQGMSQNDLAKVMKGHSADISDWLSGKVAVKFEKVCEIAQALGCEPWELLKPEGNPPKPAPTRDSLIARIVLALPDLNQSELLNAVTLVEDNDAAKLRATRKLKSDLR